MYQTAPQYQQQPFVYSNIYPSASHHSRSPSTSSLSRHSPADTSFTIDTNYLYQPSVSTANAMATSPDVHKASPIQQNHSSPTMMPSGSTSTVTLSPDNTNILPPLSEVFPTSSAHPGQQNSSSASSPIQSQVVPQAQSQQQQTSANMPMTSAAAHSGFFQTISQYSDVNAAAASFAADTVTFSAAPMMSQSQQPQIASNISVADPRTLPRIGPNGSDMQALSTGIDPTGRNRSNASMLAINTNGLTVGATDTSPMSAGSSTGSPIVPGVPNTLSYHHSANAAHHQALLNSHFMAAAQSMNNGSMIAPTTQRSPNSRRGTRSDDGSDAISQATNGERPQKVYSFVALPGINTKKRPRRRYDEIERHYACNYSGCTKSYGTLNHLNAHVQMQKHGPKRHPSGKFFFSYYLLP
ncbi:8343_t:CDS:1, partial [Racocetra fulgida]